VRHSFSFFFQSTECGAVLDKMARQLVGTTHKLSIDKSFMSPFAVAGTRALSWEFQGGKRDDITILVAAVLGSPSSDKHLLDRTAHASVR